MDYKYFAEKYFELGLKPTCISYLKTAYNVSERNPDKSPSHFWRHWQVKSPKWEEVVDLPWTTAMGLGTVLGFDNRCIDIDDCDDYSLIQEILAGLRLPKEYEWVVKTPNGYHIHINCPWALPFLTNRELTEGVLALLPNDKHRFRLKRIELRWANHAVLPPTKLNGKSYSFVHSEFPMSAPVFVSNYSVFRMISRICGTYHSNDGGEISRIKIDNLIFESVIGSHMFYPQISVFDASNLPMGVMEECSPEKVFRSVVSKQVSKLISNFQDSEYNQAISPIFLDVETTGLVADFLDHSSYPSVIQVAYAIGRESKVISHYIKPQDGNFRLPAEIEKLTGISHDFLMKEGGHIGDVFLKFPSRNDDLPLICHNSDFDIAVLDVEYLRLVEKTKRIFPNLSNPFRNGRQIYCTMRRYAEIFDVKYPKLKEMYEKLFKTTLNRNLHNAETDVEILRDCFYLMNLYGYNRLTEKTFIEDV